jgi:hypothetical protein
MGTQTYKKACQSTHAHVESTDDRHTWMLMGVCWAAVHRLAVMSLTNFQLSGALEFTHQQHSPSFLSGVGDAWAVTQPFQGVS